MTTVGYGDFTPTCAGTQIFTGLGVFVALLAAVAAQYVQQRAERTPARERLRARRDRRRAD